MKDTKVYHLPAGAPVTATVMRDTRYRATPFYAAVDGTQYGALAATARAAYVEACHFARLQARLRRADAPLSRAEQLYWYGANAVQNSTRPAGKPDIATPASNARWNGKDAY